MQRFIAARAAAVVILGSSVLAAEDLTIVFKDTVRGQTTESTQYISAERLRNSRPDSDSMFEFGPGKITVIDNAKKQYWEATLEEMNQAMGQAQQQMNDAFKNIPPEQLKLLPPSVREKMQNPAAAAGTVTVKKGTETRKIAGFDCQQYVVSMGESVRFEMWTTTALQPPSPRFSDARAAALAGNPAMQNLQKVFEEMKKVEGFPLAESSKMSMMGQSIETSHEAVSVKKGAIAPAEFALPAGYTKVEAPFKSLGAKPGRR
jgi:hypothetical protein